MKIGILGTGNMSSRLGKIWLAKGHSVFFGTRSIEKAAQLRIDMGERAEAGRYEDAAMYAEVAFLGVPWSAAEETVHLVRHALRGKVLIDCTNPLSPDFSSLVVPAHTSAAEMIQSWLPETSVVKAYNTIGAKVLAQPLYDGIAATGFYCGNDAEAKAKVAILIQDSGFNPVDCGTLSQARHLETMTLLFLNLAFKQKMGSEIAFKLLRR
ncbi:MAG: NADPH-dependent F420 reductase [Chloroherpetonaceae bacterium]|nr:NADPH-dependent F420 reductase [Chloroherpetonaceae bacterium]